VLEPLTKDPNAAAIASTRLAVLDRAEGRPTEARKRLDDVLSANPAQLPALLIKSRFLLTEPLVRSFIAARA